MAIDLTLSPCRQTHLLGHEGPVDFLRQAFIKGKVPQSWIFSGMRGIGKATFAYQMARQILKKTDYDDRFIDRQIDAGTYPNLMVVTCGVDEDGKKNRDITVDDVRKVTAYLHQSPAIPGWRIVLIDAADDLNRNAANAVLKVLEEPPSQTLFFLITHSMGRLLPTIRSRCCHLTFSPLPLEKMRNLIEKMGDGDSFVALAAAQGSLGRYGQFMAADSHQLFGQVLSILPSILQGDFVKAQAFSGTFVKADPRFPVALELILWMLSQLTLLAHDDSPKNKVSSENLPEMNQIQMQLRPLVSLVCPYHWTQAYQQVSHFLSQAHHAHLDQNHVMMAVFFMINNPELGEKF